MTSRAHNIYNSCDRSGADEWGLSSARPAEDEAMKRLLLGSVAAVALSTAVGAVEMTPSVEAPTPPAEAAPCNWTGAYGRTNKLAPSTDALMLGAPTGGTADGFLGSAQF